LRHSANGLHVARPKWQGRGECPRRRSAIKAHIMERKDPKRKKKPEDVAPDFSPAGESDIEATRRDAQALTEEPSAAATEKDSTALEITKDEIPSREAEEEFVSESAPLEEVPPPAEAHGPPKPERERIKREKRDRHEKEEAARH